MNTSLTRSLPIAFAAAILSAGFALPAHADLAFKMHNLSKIEVKGVVQGERVLWMKRGQIEDIRVKGDWKNGNCWGPCPPVIKHEYTVNFENLNTPDVQYCVWKVSRTITGGDQGTAWGTVQLSYKLETQKDGFTCEVSGQMSAPYHVTSRGQGATMNFILRSK